MLLYYWTRYIIDGWKFQWAPTLGGECYLAVYAAIDDCIFAFQWAPTLGGECYSGSSKTWCRPQESFNGHPPLGVNATRNYAWYSAASCAGFQWAPTLGGECYTGLNGF